MKNTLENKAKFFAQYYGQLVYKNYQEPLGLQRCQNDKRLRISNTLKNSWLELKPLSSISDEDAIEVAKIINDYNPQCKYTIKNKGYEKLSKDILPVLVEWYCNHPDVNKYIKSLLIQIDVVDNDVICGRYENDGNDLFDDYCNNAFQVLDYLRSKCYALDFNGIKVQQQIEYGWIKLKK